MQTAAIHDAAQFGYHQIVSRYEALYRELLQVEAKVALPTVDGI
jgi:hypothetical protein